MDRFITVFTPATRIHADLICETLEQSGIAVILSFEDGEGGFRVMVPDRFKGRALLAAKGLSCAEFSSKEARGERFSERLSTF